jgi:membrane protein DedA with SNARE-associated domain
VFVRRRSWRTVVELILIKYGLLAVFVASMLEADVVPVLAGVAAHHGYFDPAFGIVAASTGALTGDCFWFYLGRHRVIQNSKLFLRIRSKAESLSLRVGNWQIPASHVVYGTRMATMIFSGARGLSLSRFALIDGLSCVVLTTVLFFLGFALSASASIVLVDVRRIEVVLLVTITLCGLIFHFRQKLGRRNVQGTSTGERNL